MSNQRAVIFDLDDTLYAESQYVASGLQSVAEWAARRWGLRPDAVARSLGEIHAQGSGRVFNTWLDQNEIQYDEDVVNQMVTVYRNHAPKITLFPIARRTIEGLRHSYRIGLVSDGYLNAQQQKFDALKIDDLFDSVVFSDALGREHWKPSRLPFDTALKQLGVRGERATYVGDNPTKDFLGARKAGLFSIRLRQQGGVYSHLEPATNDHAPDLEVTSWNALVESIDAQLS